MVLLKLKQKSWAMKENKSLLMCKKLELHKFTIPEALPAKLLRPSKTNSFGKADFFLVSLCWNLVHFPREERFKLGFLKCWPNFEFNFGTETSRDLWPVIFLSQHGSDGRLWMLSLLPSCFSHVFTFPFYVVTL